MCTAQSYPISAVIVVENPTSVAVPALFQSPPLLNSVNTSFALRRGPRTHSGIMIANRPHTCRIRINTSTNGSRLARNVLNMIENKVMAITSRVPCHRWPS